MAKLVRFGLTCGFTTPNHCFKNQLLQLKNLIREIQPNCLINSRLGLSVEEDEDVDFRTLGDNQLGEYKFDYP